MYLFAAGNEPIKKKKGQGVVVDEKKWERRNQVGTLIPQVLPKVTGRKFRCSG